MTPPLPITPETKVGDLLESYPQLEETLVAMAPAFAKLRNPVLRRTVARVATLEQAARVGGVAVKDLVTRLREAAGLPAGPPQAPDDRGGPGDMAPAGWVAGVTVSATIDADTLLAVGQHPLGRVMSALGALEPASAVVVESSFVPAPLLDALAQQGYESTTVRAGAERYRTWIRRRPAPPESPLNAG